MRTVSLYCLLTIFFCGQLAESSEYYQHIKCILYCWTICNSFAYSVSLSLFVLVCQDKTTKINNDITVLSCIEEQCTTICEETIRPSATITPSPIQPITCTKAPTTSVTSTTGLTPESSSQDSTIKAALGAVIGVLVVLQIITLIGCGAIARRKNTTANYQR